MVNKNLIRGTLKPIILSVLKQNDHLYGYEISKLVSERSNQNIQLTEGALYPMLHKLENEGFIQLETREVENRVRKYYSLTAKGLEESEESIDELLEFIRSVILILRPSDV